ncbi:MAG TPA: hypothetical protein VGC04_04395 [Cellulomonas sp.]
MHIPAALGRDLRALNDALDSPDADLTGSITALASSARLAVESYLGLSLLVPAAPDQLLLTAYDDGADPAQARTSLFLTLPPAPGTAVASVVVGVVLYARVPGAFVDLAADARWLDIAGVVDLDRHLPAPAETTPATYLGDQSAVNQALGVLVAGGRTLDDARSALAEQARADEMTTADAARRILAELDRNPPREG